MLLRALALALVVVVTLGATDSQAGTWVPDHPAPPAQASFYDLVAATVARVQPSGDVDVTGFADALRQMNETIGRQLIAAPVTPEMAATDGAQAQPFHEGGWRLWVFWSCDAPECAGLGAEMVRVRATNLVELRPVHLAGLRQWEAWVWQMDGFRSRILQAAHRGDRDGVQAIWLAWKGMVEPMTSILQAFYGNRGVSVVSDTRAAIALKVRTVPTFRLISPAGHIHALDGFTPDTSIVDWIQKVQAWEAANP